MAHSTNILQTAMGYFFAPLAAAALHTVDAPKKAAIVEMAIGLLWAKGVSIGPQGAETASVKPLLAVLNDPAVSIPLEQLSDAYIDDEQEDLAVLLSEYLRR